MRLIVDSCPTGPCPRVYLYDDGDLAVQGYLHNEITTTGRSTVRLPAWLVSEAARAVGDPVTTAEVLDGCAIQRLDDADVLVTGVPDSSLPVPDGEALVRIPAWLATTFVASPAAAG